MRSAKSSKPCDLASATANSPFWLGNLRAMSLPALSNRCSANWGRPRRVAKWRSVSLGGGSAVRKNKLRTVWLISCVWRGRTRNNSLLVDSKEAFQTLGVIHPRSYINMKINALQNKYHSMWVLYLLTQIHSLRPQQVSHSQRAIPFKSRMYHFNIILFMNTPSPSKK